MGIPKEEKHSDRSPILMNATPPETLEQELHALRQQNQQLHAQLQQREEYIHALKQQNRFYDLSLDLLCIAGFDGFFKQTNRSWLTLGYTQEELLAQPFIDLVHPDDRAATLTAAAELTAGELGVYFENRYRCKDGSYRWLAWTSVPVAEENVIYAIARDVTDLKQKELDFQQKNSELEAIFRAFPDLYFRMNLDGLILDYQSSTLSDLYIPPEVFLNKRMPELLPLDVGQQFTEAMAQLKQTQSLVSLEYELPMPEGERSYEARLLPLGTDQFITIVRDITDRKQAEANLMLYKLAVDCSSDAIGIAEPTGALFYQNPAFTKLYACETPEIFNQTGGIIACYSNQDIAQTMIQAVLNGQDWTGEVEQLSRSGRCFPAWVRANGIKNESGHLLTLVGTITDITDRKQVEEALRRKVQQEKLLNQLADQIRSSLNLDRILEVAVSATQELLQVDLCSITCYRTDGQEFYWEVIQEAKNSDVPSQIGLKIPNAAVLALSQQALNKEITRIEDIQSLPDRSLRQFLGSFGLTALLSLPIHTQSGEVIGFNCAQYSSPRDWQEDEVSLLEAVADQLAIAIDQATLYQQSRDHAQQMEQTLRELTQTQTRLVQSEKMSSLGQLVAGVAHEINNPVNFIYGNLLHAQEYTKDILGLLQLYQQHYPHPVPEIIAEAEAIDLDFLIEDLRKLLSSMKVGADRIRSIVASLRNFSRMDEAEFKTVDIHEGIDSTLMILQNRFKAKADQPEIQVIKHYDTLPPVECFPGQLNQVFMNILVNAIDALEEATEAKTLPASHLPRIDIHTELANSNQIRIRIVDNGPGIPAPVQQRLFDPFFTTKPVGKGTGLGMSISYQIVTEKHGGSLHCVSASGQGAQFIIDIPIRQHHIKR